MFVKRKVASAARWLYSPRPDLERDVVLTRDSIFDIGSVRKQFVAAAALILVEDGRLALTDDIRKHFPELPDYGQKINETRSQP